MSPAEKRDHILDHFPAEEWSNPEYLNVLAVFYTDAPQWMRIKAIGKSIGVNVWDLEQAVKALHARLDAARRAAGMRAIALPSADETLSLEERRRLIYESSEPEVWHAAIGIFIEIRDDASEWFYAKGMAKKRGQDVRAFEQAVDAAKAARKKAQASATKPQEVPGVFAKQGGGDGRLAGSCSRMQAR
jgi:hypothetical protein